MPKKTKKGLKPLPILSLSALTCTRPNEQIEEVVVVNDHKYLIQCEKLFEQLGAINVRILDCRFDLGDPAAGSAQYLAGHIPGAVFVDLDKDLSAPIFPGSGRHPLPDLQVLAQTFSRLGIGPETRVVCYDHSSGALAARAWWLLRLLGHSNACLLDGGLTRWEKLGLPTEEGTNTPEPAVFHAAPDADRIVETHEVVERGAESLLLVDARDEARFAGRSEPIDAVAGHIPGSINLPFSASLADNGTWKETSELRELWHTTLAGSTGSEWSVMCGSGVTACHLVVSGLIAGLPEPRVYVGSWSEWITDPARPIGNLV